MHLPSFIDGAWFDIVTIILALIVATFKCFRHPHKFISGETGRDIVHGVALFPLLMLAISVFSKEALTILLNSDRIILSAAGFVALFSILESEFERGEQL